MNSSRRDEQAQAEEKLEGDAESPEQDSAFRLKKSGESGKPRKRAPARGRWAVVEDFVRDGFHYKVVRRPVPSEGEPPILTKREEEALMHAREGHSNKSIAFILGLAPSTIGVLLYRAAIKLGARSRAQLLAAHARLKKSLDDE